MLLRSAVTTAVVLFVLAIGILFLINKDSMGWFSSNNDVEATGLTVSISTEDVSGYYHTQSEAGSGEYITIKEDELISSADGSRITIPGSAIEFDIILRNESRKTIRATGFGFEKPAIYTAHYTDYPDTSDYDEVPIKIDTDYYYFGSQLAAGISEVRVGSVPEDPETHNLDWSSVNLDSWTTQVFAVSATPDGQYLLRFDENNEPISERTPLLLNYDGFQYADVPAGQFILFRVKIEFVDNPNASQDVYKTFGVGSEHGKCSRMVYIEFDALDQQ